MSARQLVVPFNFRPGARPWRRVLPRKALYLIDACGRFIQSPIVQVESRLLCYCASREPSPVTCGALIFSSLQDSAGSVEIHPSGSDPGDHEIGAPHAVEHCPRADQRYAIDDPGLRLIELTLLVFDSRDQTCRQSRGNRVRPDILLGDPQGLAIVPICRREAYLPFLRSSSTEYGIHGVAWNCLRLPAFIWPKRTTFDATFAVHGSDERFTQSCARGSALSLSSVSAIATERIAWHSCSKSLSGRRVAAISPSMSVASFRASSKRSASASPQAMANLTSH